MWIAPSVARGWTLLHLASLSTDAVPALVEFFASQATLPETREAVGAALACRLAFRTGANADRLALLLTSRAGRPNWRWQP